MNSAMPPCPYGPCRSGARRNAAACSRGPAAAWGPVPSGPRASFPLATALKGAAVEPVAADLAVVHGPVQQCHPVFRAGLGEDVADVVIDGALADRQSLGDLLVGEADGHELDDLKFALREIGARLGVKSAPPALAGGLRTRGMLRHREPSSESHCRQRPAR